MTISEDLARARAQGHSRKSLGELSGLTEGKIWRIEKKGNPSPDETAVLAPVLETLLGATAGAATPAPSTPSEPTEKPAESPAEPPSPAVRTEQQPIDWTRLQGLAAQVSEHELERALKGPDPTTGRLISNSEIQTFKDCRRKWWLGWYRSLTLKHESPVGPLQIGDRIHRAMACWYVPDTQTRVNPVDALEILIVQDWTKVTQAYADRELELARLEAQFNTEANLERAMIAGYMEWIAETGADADLRIISNEEYLEAELEGIADADGRPVKLIGKLDVRAYRTTDGARKFIDHKTVGNLVSPRQTVQMSEQMLHYELLEFLNTPEGEARCDGALYNMLRKTKRTAAAKPPFYDRVEVTHNQRTLDAFKSRVTATVRDILDVEAKLRSGVHHLDVAYPRPSDTCTWKCEFFPVCNMLDDGSRAEDMLKNFYRQHDPLAYYAQTTEE
jgi:hypothetical protein